MNMIENSEYSEEKVNEIKNNITKYKNLRNEYENSSLEISDCIKLKKATIAAIITSYGIELSAIAVIIFSNSKYTKSSLACIEIFATVILLEAIRLGIKKENKIEESLTDLTIELEVANLSKVVFEKDLNNEMNKYLKLERENCYQKI